MLVEGPALCNGGLTSSLPAQARGPWGLDLPLLLQDHRLCSQPPPPGACPTARSKVAGNSLCNTVTPAAVSWMTLCVCVCLGGDVPVSHEDPTAGIKGCQQYRKLA